jgi:hypothetical protein
MSDILRKQRERDRFMYPMSLLWQDEKDAEEGIERGPAPMPVPDEEGNFEKGYSAEPYVAPENPSDEPDYELTDDASPSKLPLIQQLQQQPEMLGPGDDTQPAMEPESQGGYAEGQKEVFQSGLSLLTVGCLRRWKTHSPVIQM